MLSIHNFHRILFKLHIIATGQQVRWASAPRGLLRGHLQLTPASGYRRPRGPAGESESLPDSPTSQGSKMGRKCPEHLPLDGCPLLTNAGEGIHTCAEPPHHRCGSWTGCAELCWVDLSLPGFWALCLIMYLPNLQMIPVSVIAILAAAE